jgi:16S rRNA (uracil1498-N3)-methyltransferase
VLPRCFSPDIHASSVTLSDDESVHLVRVLRLRVGAPVLVFDGRGHQRAGVLSAVAKTRATVALGDAVAAAPEPAVAITLAQAALKGDKMDEVIRDATMMGVARIGPLVTERTVVPRAAVEQARIHERWMRVALASAKQCGRAVVPAIDPPRTFDALLADAADRDACRLLLAEPATQAAGRALPEVPPASALIAIGPEGGWTDAEVARALAAGFAPLSLGARTLRAESAPLAALAVLSWVWKL